VFTHRQEVSESRRITG